MSRDKGGRPATPTALKLVRGERADRINTSEPEPAGKVAPTMPLSDEAQRVWDRLAPDMERKKVLRAWDCDEFSILCEVIAQHWVSWAEVARRGTEIEETRVGPGGNEYTITIRNPAWAVVRETADLIVKLGGRFGMSPSDRQSLVVADGKPDQRKDLLSG